MTDLMKNAGFTASATGPYAAELRERLARMETEGLKSISPGTWAGGPFWEIDPEVRAQEILAMEWAMERGHAYRTECLDSVVHWSYNTRTGKRRVRVNWSMIPAWLGDRWREAGMRYRVWRDRNLTNPYRQPKDNT